MAIAAGIPTAYAHSDFRSRLEARWAVFLDLIEWYWTYEPFDADGWIPDFLIRGNAPLLLEIGPCVTDQEYRDKAAKPLAAFPVLEVPAPVGTTDLAGNVLLTVPAPPERVTLVLGADPLTLAEGRAGYLTSDDWGSGPDFAKWSRCRSCDAVGVHHESGSYRLLPCGHHSGDNHLGPIADQELSHLWRQAGNKVQWKPSRRQ